ncbi:MAG: hypothetical protein R3B06_04585 [Kofleriaceae bacterium]
MRAAVALIVVAACGGEVASTPVVVPTRARAVDAELFQVQPSAPYAGLFKPDAQWTFPATAWTGGGPAPTVTCSINAVRAFDTVRMAYLVCAPDRDLGALTAGLPRLGLIATAQGLWFTEHLSVVAPLPDDEGAALAWTTAEPMRLAAVPQPLAADAHADATADGPEINGRIEAIAFGEQGTWCLGTDTAVGADVGRVILCVRAGAGLVGGAVVRASQGIVMDAVSFGDAPPPPPSQPFETTLAAPTQVVTLDAPGRGKRAPLTFTAAADSTQPVTYQISAHAAADNGVTKAEADQPTLTLRGRAHVAELEASGRHRLIFTVDEATATGAATTPALTESMAAMVGAQFGTAVDPDGRVALRRVWVGTPLPTTPTIVGQLAQSMDTFVALPVEPVAVGATWHATYATELVGQPVDVTVRSRLVSRKGAVAVVASTFAIAPISQPVDGGTSTFDAKGTITTVITAGRLVPTRASDLTLLAATVPTPGVANPAVQTRHQLRVRAQVTTAAAAAAN